MTTTIDTSDIVLTDIDFTSDLADEFAAVDPAQYENHVGEMIADRIEFLGLAFYKNGTGLRDIAEDTGVSYYDLVLAREYDEVAVLTADTESADETDEAIAWAGGLHEEVLAQIQEWFPYLLVRQMTFPYGGVLLGATETDSK